MKKGAIPILKVNALDAHDRFLHLTETQANALAVGCDDCLKRNPLSLALQERSPYIYIFAHPRTEDDGATKSMYWQPRVSKPKAETNSYLFRVQSNSDSLEICWMIPPREHWDQYKKGNVCENELIEWSINEFQYNREALERPFADDLSEERGRAVLKEVINHFRLEKSKSNVSHWREIK